jgi:hypothetical protein
MQQNNRIDENGLGRLSPNAVKILLIGVFGLFSAFTLFVVIQQGVISVFENQFKTAGGIQVFLDLVIMCSLFSVWMYRDTKAKKRRFTPWFILTLLAGSIGPLLYLITNQKK